MNINVQESFERLIKKAVCVKYAVEDYEVTDGVYKSQFDFEDYPSKNSSSSKNTHKARYIEQAYDQPNFTNIDSYKDKSKRKLIDLSFSNRSNTDVGDGDEEGDGEFSDILDIEGDEGRSSLSGSGVNKSGTFENDVQEKGNKPKNGNDRSRNTKQREKKKVSKGLVYFLKKMCCMATDDLDEIEKINKNNQEIKDVKDRD